MAKQAKTTETKAVTQTEDNNGAGYVADLQSVQDLPALEDAKAMPFDLMSDYWTPEKPGETKRVYYLETKERNVVDETSGEEFELSCAYFLEKQDGEWRTISNGAKRLVHAIQNRGVRKGTALQITYLGKKKNSTNSYKSDRFSIKPLVVNL